MIKTRTWIVIIAALAVAAAGAILLIRFFGAPGTTAEIVKGGEVLYTIDLDRVAEEYEIEIGSGDGDRNVVTVKPGMICVSSADCPEQICVNTGWASKDHPYPIVCMPHDLVIRIVGADGEADAEAR
ncbi:MAG: NusG domain II-containing protein [Clostridia bacterium]|nr:NusG domain II-containing protein [Clostridia bacterium]